MMVWLFKTMMRPSKKEEAGNHFTRAVKISKWSTKKSMKSTKRGPFVSSSKKGMIGSKENLEEVL